MHSATSIPPKRSTTTPPATHLMSSNIGIQARNVQAVKVLKRIKSKLDGVVGTASSAESASPMTSSSASSVSSVLPTSNNTRLLKNKRNQPSLKRLAVAEHVDYLVNQAVSTDNLCVMYEGWSPWI